MSTKSTTILLSKFVRLFKCLKLSKKTSLTLIILVRIIKIAKITKSKPLNNWQITEKIESQGKIDMNVNSQLKRLTYSLLQGGMKIAEAGVKNMRYASADQGTRRNFVINGGRLAMGTGILASGVYFASRFPQVLAAEEQVEARLATNPLGPEDLKNKNWLKPEHWEGTNEYSLMPSTSKRYAFFRLLDSNHETFPNLTVLADLVTDTREKPWCRLRTTYDTHNMRNKKGMTMSQLYSPKTEGLYSSVIILEGHDKTIIYDDYQKNGATFAKSFPINELHYAWARAPSPIPGNDENRLKDHVLIAVMTSKKRLTEVSGDIGFRMNSYSTQYGTESINFPAFHGVYGLGELDFSGIPVPETPWPAIVLGGGLGAVALATHKLNRRKFIFPWAK